MVSTSNRSSEDYENLLLFVLSHTLLIVFLLTLMLRNFPIPVKFPLILLIGWFISKIVQTFWAPKDELLLGYIPSLVPHFILGPVFFISTLHVDYHTLSRSMAQILGFSLPAFIVHCLLVTVVAFPILQMRHQWEILSVFTLVAVLSGVKVESGIAELKNVHGQLRQLHLLLQGEKLVSVLLMCFIVPLIFKFYNPANSGTPSGQQVICYLGWLLLGTLPPICVGLVFRYLINYAYNDIIAQAMLFLSHISLSYFFGELLGAFGSLNVICFGISIGCSKLKFSNDAEKFFAMFWDSLSLMMTASVYLLAGTILGIYAHISVSSDLGFIIVFYGLCMVARIFSLILMGLVLAGQMGWITWKHYFVAIWAPFKGSPSLAIACYIVVVLRYSMSYEILLYVTSVVLISIVCNTIALRYLMKSLGMFELSQSRMLNMDSAVVLINHCREKAVMSLKMDRVIADANWLIVDQTTKLPHPYSHILLKNETADEDENEQIKKIVCGECGAESIAPPTKKELMDITLEAKHRMLKAQMMSFWKQSQSGTLSAHGYRVLANLVEMASVKDDPVLSLKDLKVQREGSRFLRRIRSLLGFLYTVTSTTHRFIPTSCLRALCFRICTTRYFQVMMTTLCIVDLVVLLNFLVLHFFYPESATYINPKFKYDYYQIADFTFCALFIFEFIILCLGLGVIQYFQSNVNKIDFSTGILIRPTEVCIVVDSVMRMNLTNTLTADPTIVYLKTLLLLRFVRIYVFVVALIPKLLNVVDKKMDDDLFKAYDIGKAYIIALDKVMKFLGHIVDNEVVFSSLTDYMENERRTVTRELGLIQKDRPTIAISIKTRHAVRQVINTMNDCVTDLKEEGMLDSVEFLILRQNLAKVKKSIRSLMRISPNLPNAVMEAIPWLDLDRDTCNFFSEHAYLSSYLENDTIIHYGDDPVGLVILVSGLVHCYYRPSTHTTFLAKTYGVLPNYDFFINHSKIDTPQEEFIAGGGNVIGEIGVITGRKYDMSVVCETSAQFYYIPWKIIKAAIHDSGNSPFLCARIWKAIAIKIGVNLLPNTSRFQGWSREKLLLYLQRGVVPVLTGVTIININSEVVEDLFLIEGVGMDLNTRSIFTGPIMIPRTVQKLLLPESSLWDFQTLHETKMLIIPTSHSSMEDMLGTDGIFKGNYKEQDVDDKNEEEAENEISVESQSCLHNRLKQQNELTLKLRRNRNKTLTFLDYAPTLNGPLEGNITATTFIIKTDRGKAIRTCQHVRTLMENLISYTQDIEEMSEAGSMKGMEDELASRTSNKRVNRAKFKSVSYDDRFSSHSRLSVVSQKGLDTPKAIELMVIDSGSDLDENKDVKWVQTNLRKATQLDKFMKANNYEKLKKSSMSSSST